QRRRVAGNFDEYPCRSRQITLARGQHRCQRDADQQAADNGESTQQNAGQRTVHQGAALIGIQQKAVVKAKARGPVNEQFQPMTHCGASINRRSQATAMRRPASATLLVAVAMDRRNHGDKPYALPATPATPDSSSQSTTS